MKQHLNTSNKKIKFEAPNKKLKDIIYGNQFYMQENLDALNPNMVVSLFDHYYIINEPPKRNITPQDEIKFEDSRNDGSFIKNVNSEAQTQRVSSGGWSKIFRAYIAPPSSNILTEMESERILREKKSSKQMIRITKTLRNNNMMTVHRHNTLKPILKNTNLTPTLPNENKKPTV